MQPKLVGVLTLTFAVFVEPTIAQETRYRLTDSVSVLPVFFVAEGEQPPTLDQAERLMRHLSWTQRSYAGWLNGTTFRIASGQPHVYSARHSLQHYQGAAESGIEEAVAELLSNYGFNRFTCPYIFLAVFVNPRERFPVGQGRPFNGGFNTGGGIAALSTYLLDELTNFQSTLEHELGHGFGLAHVDVYGYDMATSPSIMSYNQQHLTNRFEPAPSPGILIAEDIQALALNRRVFSAPELSSFAESVAHRPQHAMIWLGPLEIPGEPDYAVGVTTVSGETFASSVRNITWGVIPPSVGPGVTYDARNMWASDSTSDGWVTVDLSFPFPVALTRIAVHSQHSGKYHIAEAIRVSTIEANNAVLVTEQDLSSADAHVEFARSTSQRWQVEFRASASRMVTIRGLEFFDGEDAVFPTFVPYHYPHQEGR